MFVLPRTVWVRNSLFIAVEGGLFSLIKMTGKLYKSKLYVFDLFTIVQMFIYSAFFVRLSACSCVWTSRVLFVLPMYEELHPGQVNSYTTFHRLNDGVLSLLLVKKHNFVVYEAYVLGVFCKAIEYSI